MPGSKFTREEMTMAKHIIRECILSRFDRPESLAYLRNKLRRNDIELYDYDRLKRRLKDDTRTWINSMMQSRWAYVGQYKERVDEYYKYQKEYWRIFYTNPTNGYLQKICLDSLQNVSAALTQLYDILPEISGGYANVENTIPETAKEKAPEITTRARADTIPPVK